MLAKYLCAVAGAAAAARCLCGSAAAREEVPYLFASDLAKYCAAADQTIDNALRVWFVMGALEVIVNNRAYGLDAHPEQKLRPASYAVAAALAEAHRCGK